MQITDAAVFYSRLTKWDLDFTNLAPHTISAQLAYTLESHRAAPLDGPGQLVVDIEDTLAMKIASVRCYKSQFPPEKQYIFPRIEAIAHQLGHAAGFVAGELLVSPRTLGTTDLMATIFAS